MNCYSFGDFPHRPGTVWCHHRHGLLRLLQTLLPCFSKILGTVLVSIFPQLRGFFGRNPGYWTHGNHSNVVPWKSYDLWAVCYPWKYDQNGDYIDPSESNFCFANLSGNLSRYPRNSRRYYPFMGYLGLPSWNCMRRLEHKQWHA